MLDLRPFLICLIASRSWIATLSCTIDVLASREIKVTGVDGSMSYEQVCERTSTGDETCPGTGIASLGIALEMGYGTAVLRLSNGTFQHIAKVEGDQVYFSLMYGLATVSMHRRPPHFFDEWDKVWWHTLVRPQRTLNKLIGRPATQVTAILSSMVSKLINTTKSALGDECSSIEMVLSSPDGLTLTKQEIDDVFDYLKLTNSISRPLYASHAAYAGYDADSSHGGVDAGKNEQEKLTGLLQSSQRLLHVDFSYVSLNAAIVDGQHADSGSAGVTNAFIDLEWGHGRELLLQEYEKKHRRDRVSDGRHWIAVAERIRSFVRSRPVSQVLLTGSSATTEQFRMAVDAALQEHGGVSGSDHHAEDADWAIFATARGAAEVAWQCQRYH